MPLPENAFRANVGAIVVNDTGLVLAFERSDIPGAWQLPQGGMGEHEEPHEAVLREVREETGIDPADLELEGEHPEWLAYELPREARTSKHGRGQVQKWFLFRLKPGSAFDPKSATADEFNTWRWMRMEDLVQQTAPFRKHIYTQLHNEFRGILQ